MAISGVKIIDSDLASDVYSEFMDLYDAKVSIDKIAAKIEEWKNESLDEVEYEIFITTYGLALWEIGELPNGLLQEIKAVLAKEHVAKMFLAELGEKEYQARLSETDKFIKKITQKNDRIRKRKNCKKIEALLFSKGDIFYFEGQDNTNYGLVYEIDQYRGDCNYLLAIFDYYGPVIGSEVLISKYSLLGHKIPSGIKTVHGDYILGAETVAVKHRNLIKFNNRFIVSGHIQIKKGYLKTGGCVFPENFSDLERNFRLLIDKNLKRPGKRIQIDCIVE